jgi:hypothetical protein
MTEYHKIQSIFKRDMSDPKKGLIIGDWTLPEFEYLSDNKWEFTEKVDGTNIRVAWDGENISFGGRTDRAQIPGHLLETLSSTFIPLKTVFFDVFGSRQVVLYGEGYGPKIQNGGKYRTTPGFVLFDIKVGHWWLHRHDVEAVATDLGLDVVPIIGHGTLWQAIECVEGSIRSTWGDFEAEGIVARPAVPLLCRSGERLIVKIKCRDFN